MRLQKWDGLVMNRDDKHLGVAMGGGKGHGVKIKVTEIGLESLKLQYNCDMNISNDRTLDNERHYPKTLNL